MNQPIKTHSASHAIDPVQAIAWLVLVSMILLGIATAVSSLTGCQGNGELPGEHVRAVSMASGYGPPNVFYFEPGEDAPYAGILTTYQGSPVVAYDEPLKAVPVPALATLDVAPCAADAGDLSDPACPDLSLGCYVVGAVATTVNGDWRPAVLLERNQSTGAWTGSYSDASGVHPFSNLPQCGVTLPIGVPAYLVKPTNF